mgnify:CR=1 FL=1
MTIGRFRNGTQNVDESGTAEALVAANTYVASVSMKARDGNAGNIYLGDSTVDSTTPPVTPGTVISVSDERGGAINLADIFVDADTNDDDVDFWYILL